MNVDKLFLDDIKRKFTSTVCSGFRYNTNKTGALGFLVPPIQQVSHAYYRVPFPTAGVLIRGS
jgi:hypothetical protein